MQQKREYQSESISGLSHSLTHSRPYDVLAGKEISIIDNDLFPDSSLSQNAFLDFLLLIVRRMYSSIPVLQDIAPSILKSHLKYSEIS